MFRSIVPFIKKYGKNPVTGEVQYVLIYNQLTTSELILFKICGMVYFHCFIFQGFGNQKLDQIELSQKQ